MRLTAGIKISLGLDNGAVAVLMLTRYVHPGQKLESRSPCRFRDAAGRTLQAAHDVYAGDKHEFAYEWQESDIKP